MSERQQKKFLTSSELAERWQVTESLLCVWRLREKGPAFIKIGQGKKGRVLYRIEAIESWENQNERNNNDNS